MKLVCVMVDEPTFTRKWDGERMSDGIAEAVAAGEPRASVALWRSVPALVEEVEQLRADHSSPEVSVAEALCDRWPADATAFLTVDGDLNVVRLTFGELADRSKRLATALREMGVTRGSRVGVLMSKSCQLPVVLVALWRLGAVHVPLFTAFAGPAIEARVSRADAQLVIVDADQLPKVEGVGATVLQAGAPIDELIRGSEPLASSVAVGGDGVFIQLYTSGTTGTPKAVGVPARAIAAFIAYMRYGLDVRTDDVFWNIADPGWAYGLYYAIVGPLAIGVPNILLNAGFSATLTKQVIDHLGVTNFAGAPTIYRAMKKEGVESRRPLRVASSAGEPLTPDVTGWAKGALGTDVYDHWGQTEQGMAIVNAWEPRAQVSIRPGSMGPAMPGFVAGTVGQSIALSVSESPLMWFTGYINEPDRTAERFTADGTWYLTGDVGRQDGSHLYFASRDDDVILAAGYRIAPFDIESILTSDDAVAEAAVIGAPDEIRGEVVEAFVVLNHAVSTDGLEERLQQAVRKQYGAHAYPRRVHVIDALPKTPSGKVQRFILRNSIRDEQQQDGAGSAR